ncbi:hypothetical protein A9G13_01285 [Gilliamella sp. wkB178]|uniref:hypothetical protein n=1 Tax=Gilliamella sp. wkB178 TaxID=3120259 RepID=UPI00080DC207|nr:hypothetical protein [Gilliamella apicola]OCG08722.1 hypothetical protein A9G13_01285 [Gilliamella apicola]
MRKNVELLLNPYRQLEAWYLYHLYSLEYGERCLSALQAVYDKVIEYDKLNKKRYSRWSSEKTLYYFWQDFAIDRFIGPKLLELKEKVTIKRKYSRQSVNFSIGIAGFMRVKSDSLFFDDALPQGIEADAPGEINDLLETDYRLDSRIYDLLSDRGGNPALSVVMDLFDHKVRDYDDVFVAKDANDPFVQGCLIEPAVYPNYLIHWSETFPTGSSITQTGVWMPEHNYMPMCYYDKPGGELLEISYPQEKIILGPKEYGLIPPFNSETETQTSQGTIDSPTIWTFVEEIPPNTEGIPNNPLRLEYLRIPLEPNSTLANNDKHYETYQQVVERYEKFYYRFKQQMERIGVDK